MKKKLRSKKAKRVQRHQRIRGKVSGTSARPRLSVFRSLQHIYAQIIDDEKHRTLLSVSDLKIKSKNNSERAKMVGELLASQALKKGIKKVIFDRGGFKYHGLIKTLAEAVRSQGLQF